jgi:hypothetical protein
MDRGNQTSLVIDTSIIPSELEKNNNLILKFAKRKNIDLDKDEVASFM